MLVFVVRRNPMRFAFFGLLACAMLPSLTLGQAPAFKVSPEESKIDFSVKASVALGQIRQMGRNVSISVHGCFDRRDGY
jgi:hypothetical protein